MEYGIENFKDLAEFISYCVTVIALLGLWATYHFSKKQIHFSVMEKCINNYRDMTKWTGLQCDFSRDYIELVNEEFFYLENNYIPIEVGIEWIDGMIDYLPFFELNKKFIESKRLELLKDKGSAKKILHDYPRVIKALQLSSDIDFDKIHLSIENKKDRKERRKERDKLIYDIMSNLKIGRWNKIKLQHKIAKR